MTIAPDPATPEEIAHYPEDVQKLITDIDAQVQSCWDRWMTGYSHSEVHESGHTVHYDKGGHILCDPPAGYFFGLSYASWLCIPRLSLQEMPHDWQAKFFALVEEGQKLGLRWPEGTVVMRKGPNNKFVSNDHWNNYRRGSVRHALDVDEKLGFSD